MAGDWIKVRKDLCEDPAVVSVSAAVQRSRHEVVGCLITFWGWADSQLRDGDAASVTFAFVDELVGVDGFGAALLSAGWLERHGVGFRIPHFERHMGQTAKRRALTTERNRRHRRERDAKSVTNVTQRASRSRRSEKRREDDDPPPTPPRGERGRGGIPAGWESWVEQAREQPEVRDPVACARHRAAEERRPEEDEWYLEPAKWEERQRRRELTRAVQAKEGAVIEWRGEQTEVMPQGLYLAGGCRVWSTFRLEELEELGALVGEDG